MVGTNIERERMPAGVEVRPIADLALTEAEPSMTKAAGGGARRGRPDRAPREHADPRGFCSHTFIWDMEVLLDGESLSEAQAYAQGLAAEGIPALVASGDRWMLEELADGELGSARLVTAKEGQGRGTSPLAGPGRVRADAGRRDRRRARRPAGAAPAPLPIRPSCGSPSTARSWRAPPSPSRRSSDRDRQRLPHEPGLARVPPAGEAAAGRRRLPAARLQRRLGSLLATPVMLAKERRWLGRGALSV